MISLNEYIVDEFVYRGIYITQVEAGFQDEVISILRTLSRDISKLLVGVDLESPSIARNLRVLKSIRAEIDDIVKDKYSQIQERLSAGYKALALSESAWLGKTIQSQLKINLLETRLNPDLIKSMTRNVMIDGTPAADWWLKQKNNTLFNFLRQMRIGIIQGDNIHDLIGRVRGTRENSYLDGIMSTTRRDAEALARTSVQAVMNNTRMEIFSRNKNILRGVEWHSALDFRVCIQCRPRDGALWDLDGNPLNPRARKIPFRAPPIHYNDRCILVPVIHSWKDLAERYGGDTKLGRKLDRLPKSTRSSIDGQIPETKTFSDWIKDQDKISPNKVKSLMGAGRYKLWKQDKLSLLDFLNSRGDPIPLKQLR